jgi:hypothetical protein
MKAMKAMKTIKYLKAMKAAVRKNLVGVKEQRKAMLDGKKKSKMYKYAEKRSGAEQWAARKRRIKNKKNEQKTADKEMEKADAEKEKKKVIDNAKMQVQEHQEGEGGEEEEEDEKKKEKKGKKHHKMEIEVMKKQVQDMKKQMEFDMSIKTCYIWKDDVVAKSSDEEREKLLCRWERAAVAAALAQQNKEWQAAVRKRKRKQS